MYTQVAFLSVCAHPLPHPAASHMVSLHRKMWQALGEMDKEEVQRRFAQLMDSSSDHSFLAWATQKVREEEEEERR